MYDSTIGRWLSEDPIGFDAGAMNLAEYVGNGPTNATDPTGLVKWDTVRRDPKNPKQLIVTLDDGQTTVPVEKDPFGNYQCHSLTFRGVACEGGPYMVIGNTVGDIIVGDGYTHIPAARAKPGDIVVWRDAVGKDRGDVVHSAIIDQVQLDAAGRLDQEKTIVHEKPGPRNLEVKGPLQESQEAYAGGYFVYRKGKVDPDGKTYPRASNEWFDPSLHPASDKSEVYTKIDPYFGKKK